MTESNERARRWRLLLGGGQADGVRVRLSAEDERIDNCLEALYDSDREGALGTSNPHAPRWLGDIRRFFPKTVVQVLQRDAFDRLGLQRMLAEPETLDAATRDVHLVATLLSMRSLLPKRTEATARQVVQTVADQLMEQLTPSLEEAVTGALDRSVPNRRPRSHEIDWPRTIRANLKHFQPEYGTVIPERLVGSGRRRQALQHVILLVDQSGSMAASVVYSSLFAAVMASLPSLKTSLVIFDTEVVDLTDTLDDPVSCLFATQLGGGTDINRAVAYAETLIDCPEETIVLLISDLYEGGVAPDLLARVERIQRGGAKFVTLLALSDEGRPSFDAQLAGQLAGLGAPAFACTPDQFPSMMAAAISGHPLTDWAANRGVDVARAPVG